MKKRLISLFTALMLLCAPVLVSCGGDKEPPAEADKESPVITGLPERVNAVKGSLFTLPTATVTDNVDKNLTCTVTVKDPDSESVSVTNHSFLPEKTGEYTAVYTAQDTAGNSARKNLIVSAVENTGPVFTVGDAKVAGVGETPAEVTLPVPVIKDVFGEDITDYEVSVKDKASETVAVSADKKITVADGKYQVTYTAEDKYGMSSEKSIILTVGEDDDPLISEGEEYLLNVPKLGDQLKFNFYTADGTATATVTEDESDMFNKHISVPAGVTRFTINTQTMDTVNYIMPNDISRYDAISVYLKNPGADPIEVYLSRSNDQSRYLGEKVTIPAGEYAWVSMDLVAMGEAENEDLTNIDALWVNLNGNPVYMDRIKFSVNPDPLILGLEDQTYDAGTTEITLPVPSVKDAQDGELGYTVTVVNMNNAPVEVVNNKIEVTDGLYVATYTAKDSDENSVEKKIVLTVGGNPFYTLGENETLFKDFNTAADCAFIVEWSETEDCELVPDPTAELFNKAVKIPAGITEVLFSNEWYGAAFFPRDLSAYESLRVRVYNPTDAAVSVQLSDKNRNGYLSPAAEIPAKTWGYVSLNVTEMRAAGVDIESTDVWLKTSNVGLYIDFLIVKTKAAPTIFAEDAKIDSVGETPVEISVPAPRRITDDKDSSLSWTATVLSDKGTEVPVTDNKITVSDGLYRVTYSVTDSDGNSSEAVILLTVGEGYYTLGEKDVLLKDFASQTDLSYIRSWGDPLELRVDPSSSFNQAAYIPAGVNNVVLNNDNFGGAALVTKDLSAYSSIRMRISNPSADEEISVYLANTNAAEGGVRGNAVTVAPGGFGWITLDLTAEGITPTSTDVWIWLSQKAACLDFIIVTEK